MSKLRVAIVGGGIGGLSAGYFLKQTLGDQVDLQLFEKASRLGGTIGVTRKNGYQADWGPNGFLDREPLTLELAENLGLTDKLIRANEQSEKRFILRGGQLREIKAHPLQFMTSPLLSLPGRLRLLRELFIPAKKTDEDETIFAFAERRLGREAAETLIEPMVTGIFGGNARKLSLGACFAKMETMEREHGGLFKAMLAKKKQSKNAGGPSGPSGRLTTFAGGFYTLIERLQEELASAIQVDSDVNELEITSEKTIVLRINNEPQYFDRVILATPAYAAADLLRNSSPPAAELLDQTPYCPMAVVCQGYRIRDVEHDLDGFGFLIPKKENRKILGSIWSSVIFPGQAPEGEVLLRTMIGGIEEDSATEAHSECDEHSCHTGPSRYPRRTSAQAPGKILDPNLRRSDILSPHTLAKIAYDELSDIMGIRQPPCFEKVIRWPRAIPQYTLGHRERLSKLEAILAQDNLVHLAGNAYTGVGLNDVIKRSNTIVTDHFAGI